MAFLVALVVTAVLVVVLWRSIGPDGPRDSSPRPSRPARPVRRPRPAPVPPDDNPEFLRDLSRRPKPEQ